MFRASGDHCSRVLRVVRAPNIDDVGGQNRAVLQADSSSGEDGSSDESKDGSQVPSANASDAEGNTDKSWGEDGVPDDANPLHVDKLGWIKEQDGVPDCWRERQCQTLQGTD